MVLTARFSTKEPKQNSEQRPMTLTGRFHAMAESTERRPARKPPMSPKVGRDMIAKLRSAKWYSAKTVAEVAGITERDVHSVLCTMCWRPAHGTKAERKKVRRTKAERPR
jgi:hypothetical protein